MNFIVYNIYHFPKGSKLLVFGHLFRNQMVEVCLQTLLLPSLVFLAEGEQLVIFTHWWFSSHGFVINSVNVLKYLFDKKAKQIKT